MKFYIIFLLILFVAVVSVFSTFFYLRYGWPALVAYLVFATLCIMPSIVSVYRWHKERVKKT